MIEQIALGVYYPRDSLLHRLQARTKLLLLLWLIAFLAVASQREWRFAPYLAAVGLAALALALSGIAPGHLWRRMRLLTLLALLGAITTLLLPEDPPRPLYRLGPLLITYDGVWSVTTVIVVFLALYVLALLLTMTTTSVALVEGLALLLAPLRRLRLPVDEFALMTLLALRFIPTLLDEAGQMIKAQQARGADFARGGPGARLHSLAGLLVPLMRAAWRRAAELADALEARGYADAGQQTPLHEGPLGARDYGALAFVALVTLAALLLF